MNPAWILAFATGFLSLSIEILWVRIFSFATHGSPQAFAFVLTFYLLGIALGAQIGKWFCRYEQQLWLVTGIFLLFSSVWDVLSPWIYAMHVHGAYALRVAAVMITMSALLKAVAFPLAHHLGTPKATAKVGRHISRVYVANILGATFGPLVTGMWLLLFFTAQQAFVIAALATLCLAIYCLSQLLSRVALMAAALAMFAPLSMPLFWNSHALIQQLTFPGFGSPLQIVENQRGIVGVYAHPGGDLVVGGNVYDGTTNLNPVTNSNHLNRLLVMATLVDEPKRVLIIGLSIGSWLKMVTAFPGVEKIDVVEINPGYLQLMQAYPRQWSALSDKRVTVHIDDARRWLRAHREEKYDLIIMNSTYHWRAYASYLLSTEFLEILKQRLHPNGVVTFNATYSPDVLKTAEWVFGHAYLYENFVVAADFDWRKKLRTPLSVAKLAALRLDGQLLFPVGSEKIIKRYVYLSTVDLASVEADFNDYGRQVEIITDRNLIPEFKYGQELSTLR